jgi:hypothetical protein
MKKILTLSVLIAFFMIAGCGRSEIVKEDFSYGDIKDVTRAQWDNLSGKRVFFGHQSVGGNIVMGVADILGSNKDIKLVILESDKPGNLKPGVFEHALIGLNKQPLSKIQAFSDLIKSGTGKNTDIAFFKFCYVDIDKLTDVESLFNTYKKTMSELKSEYPGVTFVHVTVPLVRQADRNIKYRIKKLIGRETGDSNHIARNKFNELLISRYQGKEPVFDLARLEAVSPDKSLCFFNDKGNRIMTLCPEYTDDGGHLNDTGRRYVAGQLLVFLADLK